MDYHYKEKVSKQELLKRSRIPGNKALAWHPYYHGKIQILPKCPVRNLDDLSVWYTPGVASSCKAIVSDPSQAMEHTNRGNTIAIISDATRVLGLGDIGPLGGLPVMEGKSLLFKYLGGVDAVPLCLNASEPELFMRTVKTLEPNFSGINLEDIAQPKCFQILETLKNELTIPVWHDDQQGTATVVLAGLLNSLEVTGNNYKSVKIALIGVGASNVAIYKLLKTFGFPPHNIIACDTKGTLHSDREDIKSNQERFVDKWKICCETNPYKYKGGIDTALKGANVCLAFSTPGPRTIKPQWIQSMGSSPIVFACSNPVPEIWPWEAKEAGAEIVATGRSDFPNQVNNSLGFPGIFRGVLDVQAEMITDEMAISAANTLAQQAKLKGLDKNNILPTMEDWEVFCHVAAATGTKALELGLAKRSISESELFDIAKDKISIARKSTDLLYHEGLISDPPENGYGMD